jgi:hypothetical protein
VTRLDDDQLLRQLAELTRKLGRLPTKAHIRMKGQTNSTFPSASTIGKRIGTRAQQVAALHAFVERTPEFADIAAMLPAVADEPVIEPTEPDEGHAAQPEPGFVYLVRSGKYHKIGRSNDHGRRTYEIGLQLPEKVEIVHTIETDDDAVGIEHYWHERFKDRRRNGEWFVLTKADIAAFKRRRSFM